MVELNDWQRLGVVLVAAGTGLRLTSADLELESGFVGAAAIGVAAGFLALAMGQAVSRSRHARRSRQASLMRTGVATTATATDSGLAGCDFDEADIVVTTATFAFTDRSGMERHVRRRIPIPSSAAIKVGDRTMRSVTTRRMPATTD